MNKRANEELKKLIRLYGLKQWQLAEMLGVREETICRWLRTELDFDKKKKLIMAINKLVDCNGENELTINDKLIEESYKQAIDKIVAELSKCKYSSSSFDRYGYDDYEYYVVDYDDVMRIAKELKEHRNA